MINTNTLKFLKDLKDNNSKEWMDDNKKSYEYAKNDILTLTAALIIKLSETDKNISNAYLDPKKCITRLNRDLRFAKDKTPYKTDYYIVLNKNGKNSTSAFYFLHIEPNNCFVGGGVYNPQPEQLKKIRQEIAYDFEEWTSIVNDKNFKEIFPSGINNSGVLNRTPKEYGDEHKASEYLKMKGFFTMEKLTNKEMIAEETFLRINNYFNATKPLVDFLNIAIGSD